MSWFIEAVKKYAVFEGRSRRKEFWYFTLFYLIIDLVLIGIDAAMDTFNSSLGFGLLSGIFTLALFLPSIAVTVRRLHDIDRTGWWWLISFIPIVGGIVLLVFAVQDGTHGSNEYGSDPRASMVR